MNTAIIVAAGEGTRLGSDIPKQFIDLLGKPVIRYSMERFDEAPSIDAIIVVVAPANLDEFERLSATFEIGKLKSVVCGGATRSASVLNGIAACDERTELVTVHDAARPLVTVEEIERTVAAAREFGASCLTAPISDTIKLVESGSIITTVDRRALRRALTPQAFRLDLLQKAFAARDADAEATDESSLIENMGQTVASVPGSPRNIKITYAEDLIFASAILSKDV